MSSSSRLPPLPDDAAFRDAMDRYLDLAFDWNRRFRLTGFRDRDQALRMGIRPSLAALDHLPAEGDLLDAGSGAGFPLVPLAFLRPELRWTASEPSPRKALFLRETARALSLSIAVLERPVADLLRDPAMRWQGITVRGLRLRRGWIRAAARSLSPSGVLLLWTGEEAADGYAPWIQAEGFALLRIPMGKGNPLLLAANR